MIEISVRAMTKEELTEKLVAYHAVPYRNRLSAAEELVGEIMEAIGDKVNIQQLATMDRQITIDEVSGFFESANRQFEQGGIFLKTIVLHRDSRNRCGKISMTYETHGSDIHGRYFCECDIPNG